MILNNLPLMTREGKGDSSVGQTSKKGPSQGCYRSAGTLKPQVGRNLDEHHDHMRGIGASGCGFLEDPNVPSTFPHP